MDNKNKSWKGVWDAVAVIFILTGPLLLFIALCIHTFTGPVIPYKPYIPHITIAGIIAFLCGLMMTMFPAYKGKESLNNLIDFGKSIGRSILTLALALGLIGCMFMMFATALSDHPLRALPWMAAGSVLYFIGKPLKSPPPTPEEIAAKQAKREKEIAEFKASSQKRRMAEMKEELKKRGMMCPYCESENVVVLGTTRKDYSIGKALFFGAMTGSDIIGAASGFKSPGKYKMICKSCGRQFKVKAR